VATSEGTPTPAAKPEPDLGTIEGDLCSLEGIGRLLCGFAVEHGDVVAMHPMT